MWSPDVRSPIQPGAMGACCCAVQWRTASLEGSKETTMYSYDPPDWIRLWILLRASSGEESSWTPNVSEAMPGMRSQCVADQRHAWCPGAFRWKRKVQEISYRSSFFQNIQNPLSWEKRLRGAFAAKKKQHKPSRKTELPEVPIDEANRSKSTEKLKK